jgi:hypothetical protein
LEAIALKDGNELGRRIVVVTTADRAVSFSNTRSSPAAQASSTTATVRLSLNTEGDLVIARHFITTDTTGKLPSRRETIFWSKAKRIGPAPEAKR